MSKYPTTNGYYVYGHRTPRHQWYIGMSKQKPYERWKPSNYKKTALEPYIEEYGWDNLEHRVFIDDLNKTQAELIEDIFIRRTRELCLCINQQRSGGRFRDKSEEYRQERREYDKQYYEDKKERILERQKQYYQTHNEQKKRYNADNRERIIEYLKEYNAKRNSTPEQKVYNRVKAFNRNHTPIETPLEAKQKYLEYGYIPDYIKRDDLQ